MATTVEDPFDVFLLYNEREKAVATVAELIEREGLRAFFFDRDVSPGESIIEDNRAMENARCIVVLLGEEGWGPTQLPMAKQALAASRAIIPVLVGPVADPDLDASDGLFRNRRWIDLRTFEPEQVGRLIHAIRDHVDQPPPQNFRDLIDVLVDGSDTERSNKLEQVIRNGVRDAETLASQLCDAIERDYSPVDEVDSATAKRPPKKLASIRSWTLSVLIWLKVPSTRVKSVIDRHLDWTYETDHDVRFWCLAGLIQTRQTTRPLLNRCSKDPAPEVAGLARTAIGPSDGTIIATLRDQLDPSTPSMQWYALRVLRILAIPALLGDVARLLSASAPGSSIAHDALLALAHPQLSEAAPAVLLEQPGLQRLIETVLLAAPNASPTALRDFAALLALFATDAVARELDAQRSPDTERVVRLLEQLLARRRSEDSQNYVAGYASDTIDVSLDDLDIRQDVETLASVMLAREVTPPLAIGLFGAWGSGKSFFMQSLDAAIRRIKRSAGQQIQSRFHANVTQIHFNAWHYSDANLWASLVSHLLDKLTDDVRPKDSLDAEQQHLQSDLKSARRAVEAAENQKQLAEQSLRESEVKLGEARVEREQSEVRLRDLRSGDLVNLLKENKDVQTQLSDALTNIGAPAVLSSVEELNRTIGESYSTAGRLTALVTSLFQGRSALVALIGIALFLAAPFLIGALVRNWLAPHWSLLAAISAQATVVVVTTVELIRRALGHVRAGLDALGDAKRKVDEALAKKRAEPSANERALAAQVGQARAHEEAAAKQLALASAHAAMVQEKVEALKRSQSLGHFLTERSASDDYRKHLGLISVIRRDFDDLVRRLGQPEVEGFAKVDRIILYIDDLDRCAPKIVLDVLQAVHLLLAYNLFVVVVSVDPIWLVRSLEDQFVHFDEIDADIGTSRTPQLYLEKIFQIPFNIRPMTDTGFGRLIHRLLTPAGQDDANDENGKAEHRESVDGSITPNLPNDPAPRPAPEPITPPDLAMLAEALVITSAEADFAARLRPFIGTPRAAKRFANLYRLLKANAGRRRSDETVEDDGSMAGFELPMLLLAIVVGHPEASGRLFDEFLIEAEAKRQRFWTASDGNDPEAIRRLRRAIGEIADQPLFPNSPEQLTFWLPRVARYSFMLSNYGIEP